MLESRFSPHLLAGEQLIWTGQPDPNRLLNGADVFMIPFSLMWGGFALFWEAGVLGLWSASRRAAPSFFALWGVPFVLIGLYMIFGRFFYKAYARRHTYYALTNQRALVLTTTFGEHLNSLFPLFLNALPGLSLTEGSGGVGSLVFGSRSRFDWGGSNTGMPGWFTRQTGSLPLAFDDVLGVRSLYETVGRLRDR